MEISSRSQTHAVITVLLPWFNNIEAICTVIVQYLPLPLAPFIPATQRFVYGTNDGVSTPFRLNLINGNGDVESTIQGKIPGFVQEVMDIKSQHESNIHHETYMCIRAFALCYDSNMLFVTVLRFDRKRDWPTYELR